MDCSSHAKVQSGATPTVVECTPTSTQEGAKLSWTFGHSTGDPSDLQWFDVPVKRILAIVPVEGRNGGNDGHCLLYVEANTAAAQDPTQSPLVFKSQILTDLPPEMIGDFALPPGRSLQDYRPKITAAGTNFHVIVSVGSGTGQASAVWEQLVKPFLDYMGLTQGQDYALHLTSSASSVSDLAQTVFLPQANSGISQTILLMSGDGGIVDMINALLSEECRQDYRKPTLSILPLGTGNALAHSINVTDDDTMGLKTWLRGTPQELPLFAATFSNGARVLFDEARHERPLDMLQGVPIAYGAVVCSWGLHAGLVADSDTAEYRKFGAERFKMAAKEALFPSDGSQPHIYKGDVTVLRSGQCDWQPIRHGEHAYVLVTLVGQLEQGFTISPASKPLDGRLRLIHFGPTSGEEAMAIMGKAYQGGQHVHDEAVGYEEIEGLRIGFNEKGSRWRRVCIDGKIVQVESGGWVEVRGGQKGVVDVMVQ